MKKKLTTIFVILLILAIVIRSIYLLAAQADAEVMAWLSQIDSSTERGLAYVAVAIVIHGFLGLFRPSFPSTIKLEG